MMKIKCVSRGWSHPTVEGRLPWLPYAALVAGVVTVVAMMGILGREGIGPLAGVMNNKNVHDEEE